MLARAIEIAATAHRHKTDKGGAAYILHPLRVMLRMTGEEEMMAAVLHDVIEDSPWTLGQLEAEGFPPEVRDAVDALTRREGESYADFITRAAANPMARRIKLADLEDNLDAKRLQHIGPDEIERLNR